MILATPQALAAVRAAKNRRRWGEFALRRFLEKSGVSPDMFCITLRLEQRRGA